MASTDVVIRSYQPGDEEPVVDLWNRCLTGDPMTLPRLLERVFLDANFAAEGLLLAERQGELLGFSLNVVRRTPLLGQDLEEKRGWLWAFGVRPDARGQGLGRRLLLAAEQYFRQQGREQILVCQYAPNYIFPGVDADLYGAAHKLLQSLGYADQAQVVAMDADLTHWPQQDYTAAVRERETRLAAADITVGTLTPRRLLPTLRLAESFGPDWWRSLRAGLIRTGRWDRVIVADRADQAVGYCMYGLYDHPAGRFGPFGVDPRYQGQGVGTVLLHRCLAQMKAEGLHSAWFLSTSAASAAGHLYQQAGFRVTRRFHMMGKTLM